MAGAGVAALQSVLAAEQAACYGYGVVGAHLPGSGPQRASATEYWVGHMRARDQLAQMITSAGGQPGQAAVAYQLPIQVTSAADATQLAAMLEDGVAQAYLTLVAQPGAGMRAFGADGVRTAALRALAWRGTTEAFPGLPGASSRGLGPAATR